MDMDMELHKAKLADRYCFAATLGSGKKRHGVTSRSDLLAVREALNISAAPRKYGEVEKRHPATTVLDVYRGAKVSEYLDWHAKKDEKDLSKCPKRPVPDATTDPLTNAKLRYLNKDYAELLHAGLRRSANSTPKSKKPVMPATITLMPKTKPMPKITTNPKMQSV
jgi:hypothetical protein